MEVLVLSPSVSKAKILSSPTLARSSRFSTEPLSRSMNSPTIWRHTTRNIAHPKHTNNNAATRNSHTTLRLAHSQRSPLCVQLHSTRRKMTAKTLLHVANGCHSRYLHMCNSQLALSPCILAFHRSVLHSPMCTRCRTSCYKVTRWKSGGALP